MFTWHKKTYLLQFYMQFFYYSDYLQKYLLYFVNIEYIN